MSEGVHSQIGRRCSPFDNTPMTTPENYFYRLRLRQLEMVCVLAETGSLRGACERLHASPPGLSKSLKEVERLTGTQLFTRTSQGLKVTAAGRSFVEHASPLLERIPALRANAQAAISEATRPILRIGTAPFIAWKGLPAALQALSRQEALPRVHLVEGRINMLAEELMHGHLDIVLALATPEATELLNSTSLMMEQFHFEKILIVGAPGSSPARTTWPRLATKRWILPPSNYTARLVVQRSFLAAGIIPPEPWVETHNVPSAIEMACRGIGITAVFESAALTSLDKKNLIKIRTGTELGTVAFGIAYRRTSADKEVFALLREALKRWVH